VSHLLLTAVLLFSVGPFAVIGALFGFIRLNHWLDERRQDPGLHPSARLGELRVKAAEAEVSGVRR
jgi:hypothetical protein